MIHRVEGGRYTQLMEMDDGFSMVGRVDVLNGFEAPFDIINKKRNQKKPVAIPRSLKNWKQVRVAMSNRAKLTGTTSERSLISKSRSCL